MAFATTEDIETRLGRSFADGEEAMAEALIEGATALIVLEVDKDDDWAEALDPVPGVLKWTVIEMARRALLNPGAVAGFTEQLGSYSHTQNFPRDAESIGLALSGTEALLVRRAVHGRNTTSVAVRSEVDDYTETFYGS